MKKIIKFYKDNSFLQGFVTSIIFAFILAVSFFTVLSVIMIGFFIIDNTSWWSIILLPLYVGTIGGTVFVLDDKFEFL